MHDDYTSSFYYTTKLFHFIMTSLHDVIFHGVITIMVSLYDAISYRDHVDLISCCNYDSCLHDRFMMGSYDVQP